MFKGGPMATMLLVNTHVNCHKILCCVVQHSLTQICWRVRQTQRCVETKKCHILLGIRTVIFAGAASAANRADIQICKVSSAWFMHFTSFLWETLIIMSENLQQSILLQQEHLSFSTDCLLSHFSHKGSQLSVEWISLCVYTQTYLLQPHMLVGQYVQSVLASRLSFFNSLTGRIGVIATFATAFQHVHALNALFRLGLGFETDLSKTFYTHSDLIR